MLRHSWISEANIARFHKTDENLEVLEDKINEIVLCISREGEEIINLFTLNSSGAKLRKNYHKRLYSFPDTAQDVLDALKNESFLSSLIEQLNL
jgi:hypothetical protein